MHEEIVTIGEGFKLSGMVGVPESPDLAKPAVVILNSGLMHRVGASRTSVKLSRALVSEGYLVLRFDLSGIGDSDARADSMDPADRIVQEVSSAMDYLQQQHGANRFVLYGLCSGAQNSFKTALKDVRVVGLAGIDNFGFRTKRYYLAHYLPKLFQLRHWLSFFARQIKRLLAFKKIFISGTRAEAEEDLWPYPPKEFVEHGYGELVTRGLNFLYIYTGSWSKQYNYLNQFYDMYPSVKFGNSAEVLFKPEMSHTMIEPESQRFMVAAVSAWLKSRDWSKAGIR